MARPFRFEPPAPPAGEVPRPRLVQELARRWEHRLVTVVAGPGFGKTALLVAAMAQGRAAGAGRDVWLSCEPADASGDHLRRGLAEAMGLDGGTSIEAIMDFVWGQAPVSVSLMLDDVHTISAGSEGAMLLARLLDELPRNAHVVMASRDVPPAPVGRLAAAGQLVRLQETDLVLDAAELQAFASARGVDVDLLASTGGWPALAELTANAGSDLVLDYLWDEVLAVWTKIEPSSSLALLPPAAAGTTWHPLSRACRSASSSSSPGCPWCNDPRRASRHCTRCGRLRCASS